jgi:hypothetical protein
VSQVRTQAAPGEVLRLYPLLAPGGTGSVFPAQQFTIPFASSNASNVHRSEHWAYSAGWRGTWMCLQPAALDFLVILVGLAICGQEGSVGMMLMTMLIPFVPDQRGAVRRRDLVSASFKGCKNE